MKLPDPVEIQKIATVTILIFSGLADRAVWKKAGVGASLFTSKMVWSCQRSAAAIEGEVTKVVDSVTKAQRVVILFWIKSVLAWFITYKDRPRAAASLSQVLNKPEVGV
ncbi:hypothetical protein KT99_19474 [Shewanella benthica KT99]|uniref:Uncharacterized protein n=1 Tax=Shewanella benthica KT99 TaxID=314608 RepID=A9DIW0_9GAMM|nr:hypothetical protein KT99_19474 [Shewanella benthica KT99]